MPRNLIQINRAPVLTLWAAIVAERLGYDRRAALTLGKAVAGLNAQSKGQRLGIFEKPKDRPLKVERKMEKRKDEATVILMGRAIPTIMTPQGRRAVVKDEVIDPKTVEKYLEQKFGTVLADVQNAMRDLAKTYLPTELANIAFALYEKFRPGIPEGQQGWGAKGELDLDKVRSFSK